jgi:[ribosomal protein S5]-alanine N-acetyltransferase
MDLILETERLLMRQILPEDAQNIFELDNNPNVMQYLGGKTITDINLIHNKIKRIRKEYEDYKIARFAVILKETNEFIGWSGIQFVTEEENNHINYYDLGYRLNENFWGKGYGLEAALPWVKYAFEEMKIEILTAGAHEDNIGSNKILQKCGMKYINQYDWETFPWNWYEITSNEYFKK